MTRYFYRDPLAAAWMAKHHGMKLMPDSWTERGLTDWRGIIGFRHHPFEGRFYVHYDSLHLLVPREGDLCKYQELSGDEFTDDYEYSEFGMAYPPNDRFREIIQRNGLAIMWPESEAA